MRIRSIRAATWVAASAALFGGVLPACSAAKDDGSAGEVHQRVASPGRVAFVPTFDPYGHLLTAADSTTTSASSTGSSTTGSTTTASTTTESTTSTTTTESSTTITSSSTTMIAAGSCKDIDGLDVTTPSCTLEWNAAACPGANNGNTWDTCDAAGKLVKRSGVLYRRWRGPGAAGVCEVTPADGRPLRLQPILHSQG